MIPLGTPEAKGRGSGLNPLQNDSVTILDTEGDAGASTKSILSVEAKSSNEVCISFDSFSHKFCLVIWSNYGSPPMKMYRMEVSCAGQYVIFCCRACTNCKRFICQCLYELSFAIHQVKNSEQMEFDNQRVWGHLPHGDWAQVIRC